mgnify:CR=1 FL=1
MIGLFLIKEVLEDKNNKNVGSILNNVGQTMFLNQSEEELKAKRLRNLRLKEERRERKGGKKREKERGMERERRGKWWGEEGERERKKGEKEPK